MTISVVQSVTGNGVLTLNGVTLGNDTFYLSSWFRNPSTGAAPGAPSDSNGTFVASQSGGSNLPMVVGGVDLGSGIWHEQNAASGTHTVTSAETVESNTLIEVSGLATAGLFDVAKSANTVNGSQTSQVTGTTAAIAQASELCLIALDAHADIGVADIGFTDPVVAGGVTFTTLQKLSNTATASALMHCWGILTSSGTKSATFNWTDSEANQHTFACIATFKAAAVPPVGRFIAPVLLW